MRHRRGNNARLRWPTSGEEQRLRSAEEADGTEHLPELEIAIHAAQERTISTYVELR
jgi:hypothetical protein